MNNSGVAGVAPPRSRARIGAPAWRDLLVVVLPTLAIFGVATWVAVKALRFAPPGTIRIISGPDGSSYRTQAERYKKIVEASGVKVEILPSRGTLDNLKQLANPAVKVDVGFVQGGLSDGIDVSHLVSLGSVAAQPVMLYCRGPQPVELLSELRGKRLAIGPEGSGTRVLALKTPPSFADQLYVLRDHVATVRRRLQTSDES